MKDIAKNLIYKINDIIFKAYISKVKNLEIIILINSKINTFEALLKNKYIIK